MSLLKVLSLNSIAVIIRLTCLLIINKFIAYFVGPSGYAAIGQLQNIISAVMSLSTAGVSGAVVKYTAEYSEDEKKLANYLTTTVFTCFLATTFVSFLLFFGSDYISVKYLDGTKYSYILKILAVSLIFTVINVIILSIVNGKQKTKVFVALNSTTSLFTLFYSCCLIYFYKLEGALFGLVTGQAVVCIFMLWAVIKLKVVKLSYFFQTIERESFKKLTSFSIMVIIPSLVWPLTYTFIRTDLTNGLGLDYAGNWDAMWKFSTLYLSFITSILGIYYLPKFSKIVGKKNLIKELIEGYKLILPFLFVFTLIIYLSKKLIVEILFTDEFHLMLELFGWQLVGDIIKIIAWMISYLFLAKAMVKVQLTMELFLAGLFLLLSSNLVDFLGFYGVAVAHVINNTVMLVIVVLVFCFSNFDKEAV